MTNEQIRNKWEQELNKAERLNISAVAKLYRQEYRKVIPQAVENLPIDERAIFRFELMQDMLVNLYVKIGGQFALWYYNEFKDYTTKAEPNLDLFSEIWANDFASFAKRYAGEQIVLLQGTALATIKKVIRKLVLSEEFQRAGATVRARMLQARFDKLSYMQAERIVRTEATTAANYALEQSAVTMYPREQLKKRWITSMDGRERDWHGAVNGQEVLSNETFFVGGERLMRAGQGSGRNRINCRCVTIQIPQVSTLDL